MKWVLPTAPTQPVTLNMGMAMPSWYDIVGLDSRASEFCKGLDESMERILGLVEKEVSSRDNPSAAATIRSLAYSRIVLAGFSQVCRSAHFPLILLLVHVLRKPENLTQLITPPFHFKLEGRGVGIVHRHDSITQT